MYEKYKYFCKKRNICKLNILILVNVWGKIMCKELNKESSCKCGLHKNMAGKSNGICCKNCKNNQICSVNEQNKKKLYNKG